MLCSAAVVVVVLAEDEEGSRAVGVVGIVAVVVVTLVMFAVEMASTEGRKEGRREVGKWEKVYIYTSIIELTRGHIDSAVRLF